MSQQQIANDDWWSISLFRLLGYGLLILALFDIAETFYAPNLMNAGWEFQTVGSLVERVPISLIGIWLVFYGKQDYRDNWEKIVLRLLSWVALLVGLLFLLLIPVAINAALRLQYQADFQINAQVEQQRLQLQQLQLKFNNATPDELNNWVSSFNSQGGAPAINNSQDPEQLKSQLSSEVVKTQRSLATQSETAKSNQRQTLLKSTLKWCLGAAVSCILFVRLWIETRWARRGKIYRY